MYWQAKSETMKKLSLRLVLLLSVIFYYSTAQYMANERSDLYILSTGDTVYRQDTSVIVAFNSPKAVLSTSKFNGGYQDNLSAVFNHDMKQAVGVTADNYLDYLKHVAKNLQLNPKRVTGMGTAASMENTAINSASYQTLTVTAIATGGVEGNGGRAGDQADYFLTGKKRALYKPGTINIILVIDADIPPAIMARALVTCTEAKTAALQELMAGSKFSSGLATGSGTDQTMIIANPGSSLYLEDAGKHSKLGELIGRTVKQTVKEALLKQTGLSPQKQHSVLRRMNRYGVIEETLYQQYVQDIGMIDKERFLTSLRQLDKESPLVTGASLYVHLLDQFQWELVSGDELTQAGNELLALTAGKYHVSPPVMRSAEVTPAIYAWSSLVVKILADRLQVES